MKTSRRNFLGQVGLGAGALALHPSLALPAERSPLERIRIGCIGVGNQGRPNLGIHIKNTVAVCEVDSKRLGEAKTRVEKETGKQCAAYGDYRKLLDDKNVDAVVITTPDHWHALMTIDACAAGKDVYCEKPLTLTIAEGRAMVNAARKHRRIVQTGSQQRSDARFRQACELVRNGKVGKVHTVKVGIPGVNFKGPAVPDGNPPAELDYDMWLGPAPKRPYNEKRVHYLFRFFWDYSGGQMTNFGAHHLDIAQWGLGMDDSGPVAAEGKARYHAQHWYEVPEWCEVVWHYANGVKMICTQGGRGGTEFIGDKGSLFVTRGKIEATPKEILTEKLPANAIRLYESKNHHANWLDCIRSRKLPICDVEIGHRSATVCHLGNIAIRSGKKIHWDPVKEQIVGDSETARLVSKDYRAPWKLPG
ncbi:MAG: Gfo/Idh/MocA family oxidoreductase [Gemmataceae bacterium]